MIAASRISLFFYIPFLVNFSAWNVYSFKFLPFTTNTKITLNHNIASLKEHEIVICQTFDLEVTTRWKLNIELDNIEYQQWTGVLRMIQKYTLRSTILREMYANFNGRWYRQFWTNTRWLQTLNRLITYYYSNVFLMQSKHNLSLWLLFHSLPSNPPPLSAAYMRQWTESELIKIKACRLFDTKPLS